MWKKTIKRFISDILFPRFCINCNKEGSYLCEDCFSLIEVLSRQYCPFCNFPKVVLDGKTCHTCRSSHHLKGLYSAVPYNNFLIKKTINQFKYEPYIKELAFSLSFLIVSHLVQLNKLSDFENGFFTPIPLHKKKIKLRGFNQAEEIARGLSETFKTPLLKDALLKIKKTPDQVGLDKIQRRENIKGVFLCKNPALVKNRKIFLVDDIFTTGATMEEAAKVLKTAGAKEVWGVVVARG